MIVYEVSHYSFPSDLFFCNLDGSNEKRLTTINQEFLNNHFIANVESFTYKRDEINFQGWIYLPPDYDGAKEIPVILEIHGGPAAMWSSHSFTMWH